MGAAVLAVGRERVEREQGRNDPHRFAFAQLPCDPEQPQLAGGVESIAGLDLDGRAAAGHQRVEAEPALIEEIGVGRSLGFGYGRGDSAAGPGDLLVARAGAAHRMLVGAVAGEDQMGVAIDQARGDPGPAERVDLLRAVAGKLGALADANDPAVGDADRAILDHPERVAPRRFERRDITVDEQAIPHASVALGEARC